jgi:hypothetical protein
VKIGLFNNNAHYLPICFRSSEETGQDENLNYFKERANQKWNVISQNVLNSKLNGFSRNSLE